MNKRRTLAAISALLIAGAAFSACTRGNKSIPTVTGPITHERLLDAFNSTDWLMYSGTFDGQRYSRLDQINKDTVKRLRPIWAYQSIDYDASRFEATPIVSEGVMYVTEWGNRVNALDIKTGRVIWTYKRPVPAAAVGCCGKHNRGVAVFGDYVFYVTFDNHLMALDRRTGFVRWEKEIADHKKGYSSTGAPLVVKDKVVVGIAGSPYGLRGFLDAYEIESGKQSWRFWTIPAPGEPGSETWPQDSAIWERGGATTWNTGTYDPQRNLLFWGTSCPAPLYDKSMRPGDNLYTNSLLALDFDTGKLKWHFQFTPRDTHDRDAVMVPVLANLEIDGKDRDVVLTANRNGFYYVLDRETGKFIHGVPFTKQTWAKGLDENGRPIFLEGIEPTPAGVTMYPGMKGATVWQSPAYDPKQELFFVQGSDAGDTFYLFNSPIELNTPMGARFEGGNITPVANEETMGFLRALNAKTGEKVWEINLPKRSTGGVLATAGGLVFNGAFDGYFFAADSKTGKVLWKFNTGSHVWAAPITYMFEGKQHVAIASNEVLYVFALD